MEDEIIAEIYQIFDKVFKKVITLSARAVINLINGLFGTDYPLDSTITYNWTEFEDNNLKKILADTILTINGKHSYHMEAQMEKDKSIVFRVFDYGYGHASRTRVTEDDRYILRFPRPVVIYLYYETDVPDEYVLTLEFNEGEDTYEYKVPVVKLPEISSTELSDRKMVVLIPFYVLKLRYALKQLNLSGLLEEEKAARLAELQRYILDDIIGCIEENLQVANITMEDALKLRRYLRKLCDYLCAHHEGLEVIQDMTDESFMTDVDILYEEIHEKERQLAEKDNQLTEKNNQLAEQNNLLEASAMALIENGVQDEKIHSVTKLSLSRIAELRKQWEEVHKEYKR